MSLSSPTLVLRWAVLLCVACAALLLTLALRTPVLGLRLEADLASQRILLRDPAALNLEAGNAPYALQALGDFPLEYGDLIEEPDLLGNNTAIARLYQRQSAIAALLHEPNVRLSLRGANGADYQRDLAPRQRTLAELPYTYWLQLVVAVASFLIGAWIYSLRQTEWSARLFLLSGAGILISAGSAAVYSSRELAIDGTLFKALSAGNFLGAATFGLAMVGLFLLYPKVLLRLRAVLMVMGLFALALFYHLGERYGVVPFIHPDFYMPPTLILAEMLAIIVCVMLQWFATRGDPAARAVLRWLGLSIVLCSGFFMVLFYLPVILGAPLPVSQAHSFVVFLLIYIGIAMGLRRYRLFDLGTWSFQIMFYLSALVGFFLLDALIIAQLDFSASLSTGMSLLVIGFGYLPLRDWLWRRTLGRRQQEEQDWFTAVMQIPFSANPAQATQRWKQLLQSVFAPLSIEELHEDVSQPELTGEGLGLHLPGSGHVKPMFLAYCQGGKRLFSSADLAFSRQLLRVLEQAEKSRVSYEEGRLQERRRIAQDLHDDIGSQLLSSLHSNDLGSAQSGIRKTIGDLRAVVAGLVGTQTPLSELISELRFENSARLEEVGVELEWPVCELDDSTLLTDYRFAKNLRSILRECLSNVLKHAQARRVRIAMWREKGRFHLTVADDGIGLQPGRRHGNGLGNIRERATALGGTALIANLERGVIVRVECPLGEP
jgi:signal transduction histidine kinase